MIRLGYKASAEQFGPSELLHFAKVAEDVGFDSVFVSDHFQPWRHTGGHAPASLAWLGALGASTFRVVVRHILPNALGPVIVAGTIDVAAAIITESTLSFLGLGFPPDIPTWGRLLYDAKDNLDVAPHWAMFAGGAIFLAVLTINFIGDGLRDALDPRRVL